MQAPCYQRGNLQFTWPTRPQIEGYFHAITGTRLFDSLLWNGPSDVDELHLFWEERRRDYAGGNEQILSLAAIDTQTGTMLGSGSLRPVLVSHGVWDLGFALAPAWQGRGTGTILVRLLVDIGFGERAAERLEADVFVGNQASRRVLEKSGFALEGTARSAVKKPDGRRDLWLFGLLRDEWRRSSI